MTDAWNLLVTSVLADNIVLAQLLGAGVLLAAGPTPAAARTLALCSAIVLGISAPLAQGLTQWVLQPLALTRLQPWLLALLVALTTQALAQVLQRRASRRHASLGLFGPLVAGNGIILGTLLALDAETSLLEAGALALGAAAGFALVALLLAGLVTRLNTANIPAAMRGAPVALTATGLLSLAFLGFDGLP